MMCRTISTRLRTGILISCLMFAAAGLTLAKASATPTPQSDESNSAPGGQPVIQEDRPEILLGHHGGYVLYVRVGTYRGERAFVFPMSARQIGHIFTPRTVRASEGLLFVTRNVIAFRRFDRGPDQDYTASASETSDLEFPDCFDFNARGNKWDFCQLWYSPTKGWKQTWHRSEPWAAWLRLSLTSFDSAMITFNKFTSTLSIATPTDQSAALASKEAAGDAALQEGKLYDALHDYEAALNLLPTEWAPQDVEQRLEQKAIKLVLRMNPKPAIPQDAMRHMAYAETAFQEAKGPADLDNAVQELNKALRLAPWWGAAYKNLGLLDEKASRYADAARNLQLYLLATPNAPDAQAIQMKIYSLQYKVKQQAEASN
jgi:hypothetical protein